MLRSVAAKTLRDARRGFLWWSLGLIGLSTMMVSVFPAVRDNPSLNRLAQDYPQALKGFIGFGGQVDYLSPAGFLGSEVFALTAPLLLLVAAIGGGAGAIAGEEERGTLDLLLANPLSRTRLALGKLAALVAELCGLVLVLWLALLIGGRAAGMHISAWKLGAGSLSLLLLALLFGALALLAGAATGHRSRAIALTTAARRRGVPRQLAGAAAGPLKPLRPSRHSSITARAIRFGMGSTRGHALVLLLAAVIAGALVPLVFERHDLAS